ncbi:MAG: hypothetical protein IPN40_10495 [Uliginosibacterium sp.]|nr:hypothetical protein [Uliginosibacterium sp.]
MPTSISNPQEQATREGVSTPDEQSLCSVIFMGLYAVARNGRQVGEHTQAMTKPASCA